MECTGTNEHEMSQKMASGCPQGHVHLGKLSAATKAAAGCTHRKYKLFIQQSDEWFLEARDTHPRITKCAQGRLLSGR